MCWIKSVGTQSHGTWAQALDFRCAWRAPLVNNRLNHRERLWARHWAKWFVLFYFIFTPSWDLCGSCFTGDQRTDSSARSHTAGSGRLRHRWVGNRGSTQRQTAQDQPGSAVCPPPCNQVLHSSGQEALLTLPRRAADASTHGSCVT